jgi:beta-galactosidase
MFVFTDYLPLETFSFHWTLSIDGIAMNTGELSISKFLSTSPSTASQHWIATVSPDDAPWRSDLHLALSKAHKNIWLNFAACLVNACVWAPAGHTVATEQCLIHHDSNTIIPSSLPNRLLSGSSGAVQFEETGSAIAMSLPDLRVGFDRTTGIIDFVESQNKKCVVRGPKLIFWRAATDNDIGGQFQAEWNTASLASLTTRVTNLRISQENSSAVANFAVDIIVKELQIGTGRVIYTIDCTGGIQIDWELDIDASKLNVHSIARVGMQFIVPHTFDAVSWHGRGPHENYPDRKASAFYGVFQCSADQLHVPYIFPSENGGRADVLWVQLATGDSSHGMIIRPGVGTPSVQMNVSRYSPEVLERARHEHELQQNPEGLVVHVDVQHMGIGGDNSWLRLETVAEKVWVKPEKVAKKFSYFFQIF